MRGYYFLRTCDCHRPVTIAAGFVSRTVGDPRYLYPSALDRVGRRAIFENLSMFSMVILHFRYRNLYGTDVRCEAQFHLPADASSLPTIPSHSGNSAIMW